MSEKSCAPPKRLLATIMLLLASTLCTYAKADLDAAQVRKISETLPARAAGLGEVAANRQVWNRLATEAASQACVQRSRQQLAQPFPETSDDLYLDFSRTGNRDRYQNVAFARRERLSSYALAECIEYKGEFLPALEAAIKEICAEPTWVLPAHDRTLVNFKGTAVQIDLFSSRLGWELATIDYLLKDKLSASTRTLIRDNLQRRIFKPYRGMVEGNVKEMFWLRAKHNWNSVCHAGVVGAALAMLESPEERAWYIVAAQFYIPNFLNGFAKDGYCSEGLGYWNYGFGHFVMLGETIRQATGGRTDLLADPTALFPALFANRAEMLNGIYPPIADCHPSSQPDVLISAYLCRRLNFKPCNEVAKNSIHLGSSLFTTMLFSFLPQHLPVISNAVPVESPLRTWFLDGGVLICRSAPSADVPFAVSLKGGHNAEHHNHNDLGSFIVVSGKSMVLVDPGSEVYTQRTFGPSRYESDLLNSFGHSVPVVGGKLQRSGAKARAQVLQTNFTDSADTLALDISSAYELETLKKLERTFVYRRGAKPSLTVRDEVEFTKPESFETALVTWGKWEQISASELQITEEHGAVHVKVDTGGAPFQVTGKELEAEATTPKKATRIALRLQQSVTNASVVMTITPR